ncbi:MAG: ABC transporter substrate-binding protein, partial [Dehalococcoidia bacterium]|nr:ABC transporter substrate-binding protein [Dehalococcoidia bacterium]
MGLPETGVFEAHPRLTPPPRISVTNLGVAEGIFTIREDLSAGGLLAESWSVSSDFLTWTFNMRKGVHFHKGCGEMTAEDFVYSQNQLFEGAKHARAKRIGDFWNHPDGSVEFPDTYTVKVNTGEPWVDGQVFEWMANQGGASSWVVSKKQSEELGVEAASKDIAAT